MDRGIEFIELIYEQLRGAEIVRSKGEFSERLLGKSPSYLTSMRAKQRTISSEVIVDLGDTLMAEIAELGGDPAHAETGALLRRAVAQVNNYLADQTIPTGIAFPEPLAGEMAQSRARGPLAWLRALVTASPASSSR